MSNVVQATTNKNGVKIAVGQLVEVKHLSSDFLYRGVVDSIECTECYPNGKVYAYWNDEEGKASGFFDADRVSQSWDIIEHPPKPTKPYEQLVAYDSQYGSGRVWGVYVETKNGKVYATWNLWGQHEGDFYIDSDRIVEMHDIIVHPKSPLEQAADAAKDAIQGLFNAAAQKAADDVKKAQLEVNVKPTFSFADFDASAARTWKDQGFDAAIQNAALGLTGEAGEVADLVKKAIHHKRGFAEIHTLLPEEEEQAIPLERLIDELGDILYYVSVAAQTAGSSLQEVAEKNKDKLEKRFPEGFTPEAAAAKADRLTASFPEVKYDERHEGGKMIFRSTCYPSEYGLDFKNGNDKFVQRTYVKQSQAPLAGLSQMVVGEEIVFHTAHRERITVQKTGQDLHNIIRERLEDTNEVTSTDLHENVSIEVNIDEE
ncbi:Uncharacterized protein B5E38_5017 [Bacillus cereus]|nr:Uncharacterized protein B5E38_5017 [Bacillus cereus]ARO65103.1 Uncharacterized protein B5E39_2732 [Bacillus cereus]